ncbi:unnamed protein product [Prorocentrum cordatum]|uniref:Uncharacterized protein n=1 Tax=Prorocentrum cordatum TaxID=2364126 RepID=A0ABN9TCA8_9DINO|nr:unnamed protein product [Polarella glacialis]
MARAQQEHWKPIFAGSPLSQDAVKARLREHLPHSDAACPPPRNISRGALWSVPARPSADFVRTSHPDLQPTQDRDEFQEKFTILTAEYNRVMNMSDEQIFWEAFDTGITRMATKRVDGPSLNPWERKFRQRAREQGRLEVDELEYDVDCRKQAELYLEGCAVDPSMESCGADDRSAEVLQELGVLPPE